MIDQPSLSPLAARLLILTGPSGVGKSTTIRLLQKLDARYRYIRFSTTRPGRQGETEKVQVSEEEMDRREHSGEHVTLRIYGNRYAVRRSDIDSALEAGEFPLIDWPVSHLEKLTCLFPTFVVYLSPPSLAELEARLGRDLRSRNPQRLSLNRRELEQLASGAWDGCCDFQLVSSTDHEEETAQRVHRAYLENL